MKRFSCLSAILVGLAGLSGASTAIAAPSQAAPQAADDKPVLVAQAKPATKPTTRTVQATDPPPAEGGSTTAPAAPADPAAAPAEPAPADGAVQPAISIGTSTAPTPDQPSDGSAAPAKKPARRPWAGTNIFAITTMSTGTVFQGQNQDYNPTVDSQIYFLPRFAISDAFQLRARMIFTYEWTNSDTTVTRNEPRFSDTTVSLFYRKIPEIPGIGVKPMIAVNAGLPTSPESRARTLIVNPGATLQLSKAFEHVLGGEVMMISGLTYFHPMYRYTTPELSGSGYGYQPQCMGGTGCGAQLTGAMNPSDTMGYSLIITGEWGKWSPAVAYFGNSQWAYSPKEVKYNGNDVTPDGFTPSSGVRQTSYFTGWLDYNVNAWLTAEVGYQFERRLLNGNGAYGNPFFDRNQDMRVYIGANFAIDNILKSLEGGSVDAGIVRAKAKAPVLTF